VAEKERSRNRIIKGLTAISIVILILAGILFYQLDQTEQQKQQARVSYLNLQSNILQGDAKNIDKSVLLAIESFRIHRTVEADQLIRQGSALLPQKSVVLSHDGSVYYVKFSTDGKYIATKSSNNTASLWDAATGKQISVLKYDSSVSISAFSPDGKYVAIASADNTSLWDATTGKQISVLSHDSSVTNIVFSPNGKYIAIISDNTILILNVATGENISVLNLNSFIYDGVFSPNGKYIATISDDNIACLWDTSTGKQISVLNHNSSVYDVKER